MPKYNLYGIVTGTKYLGEIEAETKEEAEDAGYNLPECHIAICHHCSSEIEDAEVTTVTAFEITERSPDDRE